MRNILLFFLSEVHLKDQHHLIDTTYDLGKHASKTCVQTNESAVAYLMQQLQPQRLDDVFYFSTNLVKKPLVIADYDNHSFTHEEIFKKRIITDWPILNQHFHSIDYDEKKADADEGIGKISDMAGAIRNYADKAKEPVCLHVDITGGFRHASMMMMEVIQLLKFSGIHIGKVIYSDFNQKKIIDVTEIQNMFTLTSGVEEFVNYGSVQAIESYFGQVPENKKGKELKKLLDAMKKFSNAIKICQIGSIENSLKALHSRIKQYENLKDKNMHEQLFFQMIDIIKRGYGKLLSPEPSRLDIIRWCVNKGFLQQAMTMCTEWIPEFVVTLHIYCPKDKETYQEKARHDKNKRTWKKIFVETFKKQCLFRKNSQYMLDEGKVSSWLQDKNIVSQYPEEGKEILRRYFTLRDNRNDINHISKGGTLPTGYVERMIKNILQPLEQVYEKEKSNDK
jgi:hypothetical protein